MRTATLVATIVGAVMVPSLAAGSHLGACAPATTKNALEADGFYMVGTAYTFWQESNGLPGLQEKRTSCAGHADIPADTCVLSTTGDLGRDYFCASGFAAQAL